MAQQLNTQDLQLTYDRGTDGYITLDSTRGPFAIKNPAVPLSGIPLFAVQDSSTKNYLSVAADLITTTVKLLLPQVNDPTAPTIAFGDGDSGFFEIFDDIMGISSVGENRWQITFNDFRSENSAGPSMQNEAASATNPVFVFRFDVDTGIGHSAADQLSLISGGVEMLRLVETGTSATDQLIIGPAGIIGSAATPS